MDQVYIQNNSTGERNQNLKKSEKFPRSTVIGVFW